MDEYFKKSGWEKIQGEVGVNGIDGLYVKRDKDGNITNVLMSESKYNTSQLGDTKDGKQMSKDWIIKKLDNLEKAYPDNQDYSFVLYMNQPLHSFSFLLIYVTFLRLSFTVPSKVVCTTHKPIIFTRRQSSQ